MGGLVPLIDMELQIEHKKYYTNITNQELIDKCVDFFSKGCTSYAISFENEPKTVISKTKIKGINCMILKGFNNEFKFVPIHAKSEHNINGLLSKGLDSIEIL